METPAKELLHRALTLAGVRAAVLVFSSVAFLSCAPTGESSGPVYYAPSPNLDEEDPCVAVCERFMAATEAGDVATLRALTADWEECSGPGQVGVVLGTEWRGRSGSKPRLLGGSDRRRCGYRERDLRRSTHHRQTPERLAEAVHTDELKSLSGSRRAA